MRTLVIDTAGPVVGVAAWESGRCRMSDETRVERGADGWLGPVIARQLRELGGLDRVAVAVGPGAFTGLRVGVATALGLAVARGVPVRCLSALALRACLVPGKPRVLAILDARKSRFYSGLFDTSGSEGTSPQVLSLGPESDQSAEHVLAADPAWAVGEGALVLADRLQALGHTIIEDAGRSPVSVAGPLLDGDVVSAELVALRYLREPDVHPGALRAVAGLSPS